MKELDTSLHSSATNDAVHDPHAAIAVLIADLPTEMTYTLFLFIEAWLKTIPIAPVLLVLGSCFSE